MIHPPFIFKDFGNSSLASPADFTDATWETTDVILQIRKLRPKYGRDLNEVAQFIADFCPGPLAREEEDVCNCLMTDSQA